MKETTIHKHRVNKNFTQISNGLLQNKFLSFKARGLIAYILSLPEDWIIYVSQLETASPQGKEAIYSAIKELSSLGYMRKEILRDDAGRIEGHRWLAFDDPNEDPQRQKPDPGEMPTHGEPATTKEISLLKNKERDNNEARLISQAIEIYNEYPRKVGRVNAIKAISKAIDEVGFDVLKQHVLDYSKATETWQQKDKEYIPHPSSWMNGQRWADDKSTWYRNYNQPKQQSYSRPEHREMPTAN